MRWINIREFLRDFEKSRVALYGMLAFLLILLIIVMQELFTKQALVNIPSSKPIKYAELIPIKSAEKLFLLNLNNAEFLKTNFVSPFFTDKFKPQSPAGTNIAMQISTSAPQFYDVQIKYVGLIKNSEGVKKGFFLVNSNLVTAAIGMNVFSNVVILDFSPKQAVLACPDETNVIMFNEEIFLEVPIK